MTSSLLRYVSETLFVPSLLYSLSENASPLMQIVLQKPVGTSFPQHIFSTPYKDERPKAALLPSLLFFSTTRSSRLMTLLSINRFSSGFVSLAHVLSPLSQSPIPNKFSSATLQLLSRRHINQAFHAVPHATLALFKKTSAP